uniref:NADH-ubiquinone oxidoreductase chain 1 n=1 Tax=Brachytemnus porcatus TaxID=1069889 RepID=J9PJS0_9CUCU|nr:NADH dehydrogenase subunit 1 [Brachytemnus porcatus]
MMLSDMFLIYTLSILLIVCVLISVAFFTHMERKVLGYIHIRKGPNKVGFVGLLQPFGDAIKLFTKEQCFPYMSNILIYYVSPIMNLFLSLFLWTCIPFYTTSVNLDLSFLFFLVVSSLGVYTIMLAGWSSNSNYAMLGSMRSVAQSISYEVGLVLILLSFLYMICSFNIEDLIKFQEEVWFSILLTPMCLMWIVSSLAETNRSPFDFAEGESELVSGFNVEYSSGLFAMLFMAEYASILFMSFLCSMMFFASEVNTLSFFFKILVFAFFWVWTRGTFPRYRYDKLMYLAWKSYLCISLFMLLFYYGILLFYMTKVF